MAEFLGTAADDTVTGTLFDDSLAGGAGDDVLSGGGGGTDTLAGGEGDDTYYAVDYYGDTFVEAAGEGVDTMIWLTGDCYGLADNIEILRLADPTAQIGWGNGGDNLIFGNDGANRLGGMAGDDLLSGGMGADLLDGGVGADTLHGGAGDDSYIVSEQADVVVELDGEGVDTVHISDADGAFSGLTYVLAEGVENLVWDRVFTGSFDGRAMAGNALANIIIDDGYGDTLSGAAGDDQLYGQDDADRLEGGDGRDYLSGGSGADTLRGGAGADIFVASAYGQADVVEDFVAGADKIGLDGVEVASIVQQGADALVTFDDPIHSTMLLKGVQASSLDAGDFLADVSPVNPADGPDRPVVDQTLAGTAGFDFIRGGLGADEIDGGAGNDDLAGAAGDDTLIGAAGRDYLDGESGADRMEGGAGDDTYAVRDLGDTVVELAGEGTDEVRAYVDGYVLGEGVERLNLQFGDALTATGNAGDNLILGNNLTNTLAGGQGDDEIWGGFGADSIEGGDGDDRIDGGLDSPGTPETGYKNIGDTLTGGAGADHFLVGYRFENDFEANGNDIVTDFTDGVDLIEAWGVLDVVDIRQVGEDTLVVFDNEEYFDATLLLKGVSAELITEDDLIFGINGTSFADSLRGGAHNDLLNAGAGNDTLSGGAGADQLIGGVGDDLYRVGAGDKVIEAAGGGVDTVRVAGSYALSANVENLVLLAGGGAAPLAATITEGRGNALANGIDGSADSNRLFGLGGDDRLEGHDGRDTLVGGGGKDVLDGGTGKDVLFGGAGQDILIGGLGADTFGFKSIKDSGDIILDFKAAQGDRIDLSGIDADALTAGDQAARFVGHFTGRAGQATLAYDAAEDRTTLSLDVDGDRDADFTLTINGQVGADAAWVL